MGKNYFIFLILTFLACGCQSSFGPRALKHSHPAYNQVIINTLSQEMLLNLVRLKYRDRPFFLKVGSVTATFAMGADIGVAADYGIDWQEGIGDGRIVSPSVGVSYSQSPTISYTPLQGEAFLKSILTPISLEAILVITQSGWSVERVFGICVERVNNLYNAPRASGPTPEEEPRFMKFSRMIEILRTLQVANVIEIGFNLDAAENRNLQVHIDPNPEYQDIINELLSLLELSQETNQFKITTNFLQLRGNEVDIRSRSIYTVLHYLSQNVEIPEEHKEAGLVTITKAKGGGAFNWDETPAGRMFKVRCDRNNKPDNAFVAVPYRGAWFYIADDDLQSKSTFMLLSQLFNLQSGQTEDVGPTLTIPVGGR